jgi:uncharacterized protein (TIGR00369 family)
MRSDLFEIIRKRFLNVKNEPIFEHILKPKLVALSEGEATLSMQVAKEHLNVQKKAHGGVLASLADLSMGIACLTYDKKAVTSELHISYIAAADEGSIVRAVSKVIHNGKTLMRTTCSIFDEKERLLVSASATFFVLGALGSPDTPLGFPGL